MEELICCECNTHIGWITDCGPHGMVFCDECNEENKDEED